MASSSETQLGHLAIKLEMIHSDDARSCVEAARRTGGSWVRHALQRGFLTEAQLARLKALLPSSTDAYDSAATRLPAIGDRVDGWLLLEELGRGAMGRVYRGAKADTERALKFLASNRPRDIARFEREGRATAAVDGHPNIVRVHALGHVGALPFLILDLVTGKPLDRLIEEGSVDLNRALTFVIKIAEALSWMHARGVLHRDLKPANVLIRALDDEPLITDFGLASNSEDLERLTQSQESLGTPAYMSPEVLSGNTEVHGASADVWALGVILYELCVGRRPFQGLTAAELAAQIVVLRPPAPSSLDSRLPTALDAVVVRALNKNLARRYPDASALAADCRALRSGAPVTAQSGAVARSLRALRSKVGLTLTVALLGVALGALRLLPGGPATSVPDTARPSGELQNRLIECHAELAEHLADHLADLSEGGADARVKSGRCDRALSVLRDLDERGGSDALAPALQRSVNTLARLEDFGSAARIDAAEEARHPTLQLLCDGLENTRAGALDAATDAFTRAANSGGSLRSLAHLGAASVALQRGRPEAAVEALELIVSGQPGARSAEALRGLALRRLNLAALFEPQGSEAALRRALERYDRYLSESPTALSWDAFNASLRDRFIERAEDPASAFEARRIALGRLEQLGDRFVHLRIPRLGSDLILALSEEARRAEDYATALKHFRELLRRDPDFRIPESFLRSEINIWIGSALINSAAEDERVSAVFDIILELSRAGIYVPIMRRDWLRTLHESGRFRRAELAKPDAIYLRFWSGIRRSGATDSASVPDLRDKVELLEGLLDDERLPPIFRSRAAEECSSSLRLLHSHGESSAEATQQRCRATLAHATVDAHPQPDDLLYEHYQVERLTKPRSGRLLELVAARRAWADERLERSNEHRLGEDRPPGANLTPMLPAEHARVLRSATICHVRVLAYDLKAYDRALVLVDDALPRSSGVPRRELFELRAYSLAALGRIEEAESALASPLLRGSRERARIEARIEKVRKARDRAAKRARKEGRREP